MLLMTTHRPRNVNAGRAAGILYGDWGTSKAYVIGLAFALAGYASFWPILAVSILSLFVGLNYIIVCKYYPNGGGVYASVRKRSEVLAIVGAFFLVADYLVTAALSALSAFHYLGVSDPVIYSAIFILLIACFNYFGPRHTGTFALVVAIAAVAVFSCLALMSLPFLKKGWHNVEAAPHDPLLFWTQFCSVIVALSGVETIANTTSVMKCNPGCSPKKPIVTRTSTPAILLVMAEVIVYTTIFGLAAAAISNFQFKEQTVSVPGFPNVGDRMLSYLALVFGSDLIGSTLGGIFAQILKIVVVLILLSAVNTAINGLIALQYIMASDEELPRGFRKVNLFGVPLIPLLIAGLVPAVLILIFKKIVLLADLYAIGFVGAIATNLGATSTEKRLPLKKWERVFMFCTFIVMASIEVTLFIQKPSARYFVIGILIIGLGLRSFAKAMRKRKQAAQAEAEARAKGAKKAAVLCVVKKLGNAVRAAVDESNKHHVPLNVIFVREQRVIAEEDYKRTEANDPVAKKVLNYLKTHGKPELINFQYSMTDSFENIAIAYAERYEANRLIIDEPASKILIFLRGNYARRLYKNLPEHITLVAL
jgi:amino acid transporter